MTTKGSVVKPWPSFRVYNSWSEEWAIPLGVRWAWIPWAHFVYIMFGPFGLEIMWEETRHEH